MNKGDFVRIDYVGRLESGEIFDLTDAELAKEEKIFNPRARYGPVPVIVGAGFVVPGLDKALSEMSVGERRDIVVKPEEGFGQRNAQLVRTVPGKLFKHEPAPGQVVDFGGMRGRVQSVSAGRVRVDFNHPLAGKALKYSVDVREKIEGAEAQIGAILEFFGIKADIEIGGNVANIHARLPDRTKEKISALVLEYVKGIEKVNFVESFQKRATSEMPSKT
ncbi:MAG: peptidylprolyl isomerase [Candidatus Aenigmatarchaeota archaeon]